MAFTLVLGNVSKVVETEEKKLELLALGYTLSSGSAGASDVALGSSPYYTENYSNKIHPAFRGEGFEGEAAATLGYIIKKAQAGIAPQTLLDMKALYKGYEKKTAGSYTACTVVAALPTSQQSQTTLYYLSGYDAVASKAAGFYYYSSASWHAYSF